MELSEWRMGWLVVLFDLPVTTEELKRAYIKFHRFLVDDGFARMQYSVYTRHTPSREHADKHVARVKRALPHDGEIRIMKLTEAQFARMEIFRGRKAAEAEEPPQQLAIF